MWIKNKYNATTLQLSHSLLNDMAWGVPHAVLISQTNYSNCITNCTIGICCLHMQQMSVIVPSWNWSGREWVLHSWGEEHSHRGSQAWSCARYFSRVLSWQLSQGIPFPAFVTTFVGWELNRGIQFMFNSCPCCGCAPFHALHSRQVLSTWALGILLWAGSSKQLGGKNQFACCCFIFLFFFFPPHGSVLAQLWFSVGWAGAVVRLVLAAVWMLQE